MNAIVLDVSGPSLILTLLAVNVATVAIALLIVHGAEYLREIWRRHRQ
jgi:hypothetical protein